MRYCHTDREQRGSKVILKEVEVQFRLAKNRIGESSASLARICLV